MTLDDIRSDLFLYTRYMHYAKTGGHWIENWHQREVCRALERVITGDITRLIINVPPRSGKTDMAVKAFMEYGLGVNPSSKFIHASYSKRLAASNTYSVRATLEMEAYRELFDVQLKDDSKAKDEFQTSANGVVYAAGSAGTITGYGAGSMSGEWAGAIIIDDPIKPDEADSDVIRDGVIDWFQNTIESRKNNPRTPIIVVMQRVHENDLSGWLLGGGNGEEWTHINVPAIQEDGSSFWPDQFPIEMLNRLNDANPYVFAGQYMQSPSPLDGGDFKPENIQIVDALPAGLKFVRGWDLASTTNKTSDYTAGVKIAVDKDGITWIADVTNFRGSPDEVERTIVQTAQLESKDTTQSIPQDPGQAGVHQKAYLSKKLRGVTFTFSTESGDKRSRASSFASQVNVGNVRMLRGDWNAAYVAQLKVFPNGTYDDMVDASSRAYNEQIKPTSAPLGLLMKR